MATTTPQRQFTLGSARANRARTEPADWRDPRDQAFAVMRLAFTVAPIAFGVDKFFNLMIHWCYDAPRHPGRH